MTQDASDHKKTAETRANKRTALQALMAYEFRTVKLDEDIEAFTAPGVVVIACEDKTVHPGEVRFRLITAIDAPIDVLSDARRLLGAQWACDGATFALVAAIQSASERQSAIEDLAPMCSAGI